MRPKAEWAIDSEAIRARGIIVKENFDCYKLFMVLSESLILVTAYPEFGLDYPLYGRILLGAQCRD